MTPELQWRGAKTDDDIKMGDHVFDDEYFRWLFITGYSGLSVPPPNHPHRDRHKTIMADIKTIHMMTSLPLTAQNSHYRICQQRRLSKIGWSHSYDNNAKS